MSEPSFLQMLKQLFGAAEPPLPEPAPHPAPRPPAEPASTLTPMPDRTAPVAPPAPLDLSRVPAAVRDRVATIQRLIGELEGRAADRGLAGSELAELGQIGALYLPRLLQSYAEIPAQHRAEIFRDTGRSASFLLGERLDKIIDRLNEISRDFARGHLDAFSDNMRFIDLRYGGGSPFD